MPLSKSQRSILKWLSRKFRVIGLQGLLASYRTSSTGVYSDTLTRCLLMSTTWSNSSSRLPSQHHNYKSFTLRSASVSPPLSCLWYCWPFALKWKSFSRSITHSSWMWRRMKSELCVWSTASLQSSSTRRSTTQGSPSLSLEKRLLIASSSSQQRILPNLGHRKTKKGSITREVPSLRIWSQSQVMVVCVLCLRIVRHSLVWLVPARHPSPHR